MSERKKICHITVPNESQMDFFIKEMILKIENDDENKTIVQKFDYTKTEAEFINKLFKDQNKNNTCEQKMKVIMDICESEFVEICTLIET